MKKARCNLLFLACVWMVGCETAVEVPALPDGALSMGGLTDMGSTGLDSSFPDAQPELPLDSALDLLVEDSGVLDMASVEVDALVAMVDAGEAEIDAQAPSTASCFEGQFVNEPEFGPDYDQFGPRIAPHCLGTDHQEIENIERVVFVGDSVTVGTPPQDPLSYYRYLLALQLAEHFGLEPPDWTWAQVNLIAGTSLIPEAGDFACCARYGARTDDFIRDNGLLAGCVTPEQQNLRTLFVITMGGNDISSLTQEGLGGATVEALWAQTESFVELMRQAVRWVKDPVRFPNGSYVVFANMFEFTDGTGDVTACPAAGLAGFGAEWDDPDLLAELVVWANEQYMDIAVEAQGDMIFMLEHFCGHGFNSQNPEAPCFRGPDAENWFDLSCIHPNTQGHREIADMFMETITQ